MNKRRFVLIIAVARYADSSVPPLPGAQRDAERFRSVLERNADGGVYRMHWLCDGKATKQGILNRLVEITHQAGATDQVVIYFAGHGWRDRDTTAQCWKYYLIPYDATLTSAGQRGIAVDELRALFGVLPAQELVLILDCCHSGGMANTYWTGDVLEELLQGWRSHYVMAASRGYEQAGEDEAGGFFTKALCDALCGDGVTPDDLGRISAQKAWSHAADLVQARADRPAPQQVAVSSGISSPIYLTCVKRDLAPHKATSAQVVTNQATAHHPPAPPLPDNPLHALWDCLDPHLQDAFSLAYNKKRREGSTRISTRDFFQALMRIRDGALQALLESLPKEALPEPVAADVPASPRLLEEDPLLSDCVAESLSQFKGMAPLPRKISPADVFVDVAKYGHGPSVARLRRHGVGPVEVEEQVQKLGLSVLRRTAGEKPVRGPTWGQAGPNQ
jgi:hypothetical protein